VTKKQIQNPVPTLYKRSDKVSFKTKSDTQQLHVTESSSYLLL